MDLGVVGSSPIFHPNPAKSRVFYFDRFKIAGKLFSNFLPVISSSSKLLNVLLEEPLQLKTLFHSCLNISVVSP